MVQSLADVSTPECTPSVSIVYVALLIPGDIYGGTILGTLCWVLWELFGPAAEAFVNTGSLLGG